MDTWRKSERVGKYIGYSGMQKTKENIRESKFAREFREILLEGERQKYLATVNDR